VGSIPDAGVGVPASDGPWRLTLCQNTGPHIMHAGQWRVSQMGKIETSTYMPMAGFQARFDGWRLLGIDFRQCDDDPEKLPILVYEDEDCAAFHKLSGELDDAMRNKIYPPLITIGPDIKLSIPSLDLQASWHACTKSAKREVYGDLGPPYKVNNMLPNKIGTAYVFTSVHVQTTKYMWWRPDVEEMSCTHP
jgi:hypothetical protein